MMWSGCPFNACYPGGGGKETAYGRRRNVQRCLRAIDGTFRPFLLSPVREGQRVVPKVSYLSVVAYSCATTCEQLQSKPIKNNSIIQMFQFKSCGHLSMRNVGIVPWERSATKHWLSFRKLSHKFSLQFFINKNLSCFCCCSCCCRRRRCCCRCCCCCRYCCCYCCCCCPIFLFCFCLAVIHSRRTGKPMKFVIHRDPIPPPWACPPSLDHLHVCTVFVELTGSLFCFALLFRRLAENMSVDLDWLRWRISARARDQGATTPRLNSF